jgi:exonuclease I
MLFMTFFIIPFLVGAFGWCLVWAISIMPFKWSYLADQWVGQVDLKKVIPALTENDPFESMKPVINDKLDDFFRHKLSAKLPMISMFIGDKTIEELKAVFMEELALLFPLLIIEFSAHLNKDFQQQWEQKFRTILQQKVIKASMPFRRAAFAVGAIWGTIIALILPLI